MGIERSVEVKRFHSSVPGLSPAQTSSLLKSSQWKKKLGLNAPAPGLAKYLASSGVIPTKICTRRKMPVNTPSWAYFSIWPVAWLTGTPLRLSSMWMTGIPFMSRHKSPRRSLRILLLRIYWLLGDLVAALACSNLLSVVDFQADFLAQMKGVIGVVSRVMATVLPLMNPLSANGV